MMGSKEFIQFAKEQVADYFNGRADKTDKNGHIETGDVFVVWYLQDAAEPQSSAEYDRSRRYVLRDHLQWRQAGSVSRCL